MAEKSKKFYITTSIAYTNAPPHAGFALEAIQADVLARYHRILSEDVFFLTGTDEHGAKVVKAAEKENKTPKAFVDGISDKFKALKELLNLSTDDFIRTTDQKRHWPAVKKVWLKLKESGDIYKKKYQGLYCVGCEAFITKKDLVEGKCAVHQTAPEKIEEENYFFKLSKYEKEIEKTIRRDLLNIVPESKKNEMIGFIKQGLEDVSFSRPSKDLKWGIPVPDDPSQKIYVWAEALTNYISAIGYENESEGFKKYWPADIHCVGKDILKFHALFWPAMLLSLGLELPKTIFVHGFITVAGQKMSKSLGNVIDPFELVKKYGTDSVRYYLLREIPSTDDGDFTYEKFEARHNADLAAGIGNLTARVITLAEKIPTGKIKDIDKKIEKEIIKAHQECKRSLNEFKFNEALKAIWGLIGFCDKYIEEKKPWETSPTGRQAKNPEIIFNLLVCLAHIAKLLLPFLPETSEKIFNQLGVNAIDKQFLRFNIKKSEILFKKI